MQCPTMAMHQAFALVLQTSYKSARACICEEGYPKYDKDVEKQPIAWAEWENLGKTNTNLIKNVARNSDTKRHTPQAM